MAFVKAERQRARARIALTGPSGSGKTLSALLLAMGIGGGIATIDTEYSRLSYYANDPRYGNPQFDTQLLQAPFTPERYIELIHEAERATYDILLIDSITHEWEGSGGLCEVHDRMTGNSWTNWQKITPRHQAFVNAILQSPLHIIVTIRTKQEYTQVDVNGKQQIQKLGMKPIQRPDTDYEFPVVLSIDMNHIASTSGGKDNLGLWDNRYEMISAKHGEEFRLWFEHGIEAPPRPIYTPVPAAARNTSYTPSPASSSQQGSKPWHRWYALIQTLTGGGYLEPGGDGKMKPTSHTHALVGRNGLPKSFSVWSEAQVNMAIAAFEGDYKEQLAEKRRVQAVAEHPTLPACDMQYVPADDMPLDENGMPIVDPFADQ